MGSFVAVDASVVVRFLTGDDKLQSPAAADLFRAASVGEITLLVPTSTIQESVYVLERLYHQTPTDIASKLISLLAIPNVSAPEGRWVANALQSYRSRNCDFGDALLCAFAGAAGCGVATFDKDIPKRFPEIASGAPGEWLAGNVPDRNKPRNN